MKMYRHDIQLAPHSRGFHLVTADIERQLPTLETVTEGLAHLFIRHTSASLTINENADPSVREDMERHFNVLVPERAPYYTHTMEGADDMPAHLKASLLGAGLLVPIHNGRFDLGTWQGIYLCEHRRHGGVRSITVTILANE